jgi:hypothetical protein
MILNQNDRYNAYFDYTIVYKYYMVRGEIGQTIFPRYWLRAYHPNPKGEG